MTTLPNGPGRVNFFLSAKTCHYDHFGVFSGHILAYWSQGNYVCLEDYGSKRLNLRPAGGGVFEQ